MTGARSEQSKVSSPHPTPCTQQRERGGARAGLADPVYAEALRGRARVY